MRGEECFSCGQTLPLELIKELESSAVGESSLARDYKKYVETLGGTSAKTRCEYDEGVNYDPAGEGGCRNYAGSCIEAGSYNYINP